ncbi:glutamate-tRNA ligase [Babesia caballi]|uniref:Glutamate-tRNA ligase n=1 Tax=Babesia caballi TaxID=5871 RepID=A0AAV4LWA2_BABCB|nr:glutamate-tRNA ligase [Babesia caballi]
MVSHSCTWGLDFGCNTVAHVTQRGEACRTLLCKVRTTGGTPRVRRTACTTRSGGDADGLPETNEQMVDLSPELLRQQRLQLQTGVLGSLGFDPTQPVRNPVHVQVDGNAVYSFERLRSAL